jgi:hypothetical protein
MNKPDRQALPEATAVFRKVPSASFTRFGEEGLLVVPKEALQLVLNGTGARVFELVDGSRSVAAIAEVIAAEYTAGDEASVRHDVAEMLADLAQRKAIEPVA